MSDQTIPTPRRNPALDRLDRLVGSWEMRGHVLGSEEENILGRATYRWLPGGHFLLQEVEMDFAGMVQIQSHEVIGYDEETGGFASLVYSNMSPTPLPYKWDMQGDTLTISVNYGPMDATFTGRFSEDGNSFSGGWRPNEGADPSINVPYDIGGTRAG